MKARRERKSVEKDLLHSRSWWIFSSGNSWQYQGAVHLPVYKWFNRKAFNIPSFP